MVSTYIFGAINILQIKAFGELAPKVELVEPDVGIRVNNRAGAGSIPLFSASLAWVRLFCVGGPEGSRRGCERHGKSYLTRRRRGEEGDGGGSLTGGAIPSA